MCRREGGVVKPVEPPGAGPASSASSGPMCLLCHCADARRRPGKRSCCSASCPLATAHMRVHRGPSPDGSALHRGGSRHRRRARRRGVLDALLRCASGGRGRCAGSQRAKCALAYAMSSLEGREEGAEQQNDLRDCDHVHEGDYLYGFHDERSRLE